MEFPVISGTRLGDGIEKGIPATNIGPERMFHPDAIPEMDAVRLAGTAAIGVILPFREERRKHTVLHVKHRHVLMER
jgi:hypothetical protein